MTKELHELLKDLEIDLPYLIEEEEYDGRIEGYDTSSFRHDYRVEEIDRRLKVLDRIKELVNRVSIDEIPKVILKEILQEG